MRERRRKLSEEQNFIRDEDLLASIKDQLIKVDEEITRFEAKGEATVKHLKEVMLDWSGGKVSVLEALLTAERLGKDTETLDTFRENLLKDKRITPDRRHQIDDILKSQVSELERQVLELTTLLIGTQVNRDDYSEMSLLWRPADVGSRVRLMWDVVTQRWVIPANMKPIRKFADLVNQLSQLHAPNGRDGDVLDVEGWPSADGKWTFKTRIQTATGVSQCSS